jgi:hypothetical protein
MNIDTMPAGKDMDVLIAEKVMGWKLAWGDWTHWDTTPDAPERCIGFLPSFSSEIEDAWQVMEKMRLSIVPISIAPIGKGWMASKNSYFADHETCHAATASLAICRAALKVVGVPSERDSL